MYRVLKRDGITVEFEISKISAAIVKAFEALNKNYHPSVINMLALQVSADFETKIKDGVIAVEDIQDSVEKVLSDAGYADVAKAYILYRKQREKIRNVGSALLNYKDLVDNYLQINDWRVKENSTVTYSVGGLILSNSGAITANYWLSEIYDAEIAEAHRSAALHLHDLSMLTGYCAATTEGTWEFVNPNQELQMGDNEVAIRFTPTNTDVSKLISNASLAQLKYASSAI